MFIDPGQGQTTPLGQTVFIDINLLSICSFDASIFPLNDFIKVFTIYTYRRPIWPCRKIGIGQSGVSIYINIVELQAPELHAKF